MFIGPADCHLTTSQVLLLKDAIQRSKLKLQQFCVEHRDLHVINSILIYHFHALIKTLICNFFLF